MTIHTCRMRLLGVVLLLAAALLPTLAVQPALNAYNARLPTLKAQIPALTASATQAANAILDHPGTLLNVPYWEQMSFCEELMNRSGGLAHAMPTDNWGRVPTRYDVVLLTVRSWESQREMILNRVRTYKAKGWTVTVFGSKIGKPANLGADFFIENGAPTAAAAEGRINVLANTTLGWMWCAEYAAAMSRRGKFPAILQSICIPGAMEYDRSVQSQEGRHTVVDSPKAIPAGALATAYLKRVDKLMKDLKSRRIQGQVRKAAEIAATRLAAGGTVGISGMGHGIIQEAMVENKSPFTGFRSVFAASTAFKTYLQPGDLLIWMSYNGMNSALDDYARFILARKLDLITCYAPDPVWSKNPPPTLAHIDQSWTLPDAEVSIPVFPNYMAPVSGINVILISRMLDDEVFARLQKKKWQPAPARPVAPAIIDEAGEAIYGADRGDAPIPERQWGFVDATGKEVTPPLYQALLPMRELRAAVNREGKWGYLDAEGRMVIAPAYDSAASFAGGVALVSREGKWGYIDTAGKIVVPLQYDMINEPFGMAVPPYAIARAGTKSLLLDRKGAILIPAGAYEMIGQFSETCVTIRANGKMGLVDLAGKVVLPPQYESIGRFRRGYATVQMNGKTGAIDAAGREIVAPKYDGVAEVMAESAIVRIGESWGVISRGGAEITPPKYEQVMRAANGVLGVRLNNKWGAINAAGREIIAPQYDEVAYPADGMIPVRAGDKWGYLSTTLGTPIPLQYDTASPFAGGAAMVTLNSRRLLIDKTGAEIVLPGYDYLASAGEGLFKVASAGKWGYIDRTGKEIVAPRYSCVLRFVQGVAQVAVGGQWTTTAGKYPMLVGGKWGLIDATGKEIVTPDYDRVTPFGPGRYAVARNIELFLPQP